MNEKIRKMIKTSAIAVFFLGLLLNIKLSISDPFLSINNQAIAQTTSSSPPITCDTQCIRDPDGICSFICIDANGWHQMNSCLGGTKRWHPF